MRRRNRVRSMTAITRLLAIAVLGTWLVSMYCVTSIAAEYAAARYLTEYHDFASVLSTRSLQRWLGREFSEIYENYDRNRMWEAVDSGSSAGSFHNINMETREGGGFLPRLDRDEVYSAAAIYDPEGKLLECSWRDYFYFEYLTEEQWQNREERSGNHARALFDREKMTEAGRAIVADSSLTFDASAMRFTGTFDGVDLTPCKIECIDWDAFQDALFSKGGGTYTVPGVVEDNALTWITIYEDPEAAAPDGKRVTLYSDWFDVCYNQPAPAFSYGGSTYENVSALTAELGPKLADGLQDLTRYEGMDLLIPSVNYCTDFDGQTHYSPYFYGEGSYEEEAPQLRFYTVSIIYCSPWRTAFRELRNVYLVTFALALVLLLIVRSQIKKRLVQPVAEIVQAMGDQWKKVYRPDHVPALWGEAEGLAKAFDAEQDWRHIRINEINRLTTALEYAKAAEQNRRQMTSNIAHELKTPLAVIHSYAEGLKEHIAEEKREKYVDVILAEAERTDALVLEMLDLSRLEAGKVKLSRDEFSLIDLTRAVFEKLERTAQARNLQIEYQFPPPFTITADEGRIAQVIENFASNAVKYTPEGGRIMVCIQNGRDTVSFSIANESAPLPEEALERIWDTFYRVDEARSGGGTGLGLAIAKSIVELHGGRCSVRNTDWGVEFRFTL